MNNLQTVDLNTAQEKLPELVKQVYKGNRAVVITSGDVPMAKLEGVKVIVRVNKRGKQITKRSRLEDNPLWQMCGAGGEGGGGLSENIDEIYDID